jgi:hypothetical protein
MTAHLRRFRPGTRASRLAALPRTDEPTEPRRNVLTITEAARLIGRSRTWTWEAAPG